MITGFNQDVVHKGKVYHVQTEDRGLDNPVIETLIYAGGEILASKKTSYKELVEHGYEEAKLAALLEQQHRRIVVDIKLGKYSKEPVETFGQGLISSKSLDEVILEYLTSESEGEKLVAEILDQSPYVAGERGWVHLKVQTDITRTHLPGASVSVRLAASDGHGAELYRGSTGPDGLCNASFLLPPVEGNAVVVIQVTHAQGSFQTKSLITKRSPR